MHTCTQRHTHTDFFQAQTVLYFQPAGLLRGVSFSLTGGDKLLSSRNHSRSTFLPGPLLTLRLRHCRPLSVTLPWLLIYRWARSLHAPQMAAPRSPSSKFHTCLLSGLPWMHRVHPWVPLEPLSPTIWSVTTSCWLYIQYPSRIHTQPSMCTFSQGQGLLMGFLGCPFRRIQHQCNLVFQWSLATSRCFITTKPPWHAVHSTVVAHVFWAWWLPCSPCQAQLNSFTIWCLAMCWPI